MPRELDLDYERDVNIDEMALDVEFLEQPRLMLRYCKHAAETKRWLDLAKEKLEVEKAKLGKDIRAHPENYGVEKVTESSVQDAVLMSKSHQDAAAEFADARYENEIAVGVLRSLDQRKTALENLVRLQGMSYFASPSVPRDLPLERQKHDRERTKSANRKVTLRRRE